MIFFDMDGTLAKFYADKNYMERMYEKGYFFDLAPYKMVEYVNKLASEMNDSIYILSACVDSPYCEQEKRAWLRTYLPTIPESNYIFTKVGESKAKKVADMFGGRKSTMILIDDYSQNLYEWQMFDKNYIAIKFINGINNKKGNEYKYAVKTNKQLEITLKKLNAII